MARALEAWDEVMVAAVSLRHDLHRHPELGYEEERTAAVVREALDRVGIPWRSCAGTGTVATLAPEAKGRHLALRADIDALPITEETTTAWTSQVPGKMHACGHDGHTATLCAAAWWLKQVEDRLPGPVTLLFQPAEEGGHGAKRMIEGGALDGVDAIFGWHNWPAIPRGQAVCPDGPVMAANGTFRITLSGRGGHASQPESCADPVLAAAALTLALQQVVSRRMRPQDPSVLSVTSIDACSAETVIPERAVLAGSIRASGLAERAVIYQHIEAIASATATAYGVSAEVEPHPRYGATVNHPDQAAEFRSALGLELGADWHCPSIAVPIMASEDFSYYLQAIPGAFALIGSGDAAGGTPPCHSPRYDFDDALIPVVTRLFARLAGAALEPPGSS